MSERAWMLFMRVLVVVIVAIVVFVLLRPLVKNISVSSPNKISGAFMSFSTRQGTKTLQFSYDGQFLISVESDDIIYVRKLSDGSLTRRFKYDDYRIDSMALHPSKSWVAAATTDGLIHLWDYQTGNMIYDLIMPAYDVPIVAFSPNGEYLAAVNNGGKTVLVWQLSDFALKQEIQRYAEAETYQLAFASDNNSLFLHYPFEIWSAEDGTLLEEIIASGTKKSPRISHLATSKNSPYIITSYEQSVNVWSQDGKSLGVIGTHPDEICSIAISNDARLIAMAPCLGGGVYDDFSMTSPQKHEIGIQSIRIKDRVTGELVRSIDVSEDELDAVWSDTIMYMHNHHVTTLAFSPDGTLLASGGYDKYINIWRVSPDTAAP